MVWYGISLRIFQGKTWLPLSGGSNMATNKAFYKMMSQTHFQNRTEMNKKNTICVSRFELY